MTVEIQEEADGKLLTIHVTGKLSKADYEAFVPVVERRIEEHGKVRMLVTMEDFHGWGGAALWEDLKFDLHHFNDIDRLAFAGDTKWEKGMAAFCKPFTTAEVRWFELEDVAQARRWLREP